MHLGVSLKTVFDSAVSDSTHHIKNGNQLGGWGLFLGGLFGSLLLGTTMAQATPMRLAEVTANRATSTIDSIRPIEDGIYFYSSSTQPNDIGHTYMVFEAQGSTISGAIFMPQSSFDCFSGHVSGNELALQITNSYTQEVYDYAIALITTGDPIAAVGTPEVPLQLNGFHDLGAPSDADMILLETCRTNVMPTNFEL